MVPECCEAVKRGVCANYGESFHIQLWILPFRHVRRKRKEEQRHFCKFSTSRGCGRDCIRRGGENVDGAAGGASVLYSGSNYYHNGGNSNPVPQNEDSVYLCNAVSTGGKYETNSYSNRKPLATALQSTKIYRPFGAAGGGSTVLVLQSGQVNNSGAVGCCGAVTIEKVVQ